MKIEEIKLIDIKMRLRRPFRTSFGVQQDRDVLLVQLRAEGKEGWGECVADKGPWYSYETINSCSYIIQNYIGPWLKETEITHPSDFPNIVKRIRGNQMAKACVEDALWDLYGQIEGQSLSALLGGTKKEIPSGISLGIENELSILIKKIEDALSKNYKRIKIKIEPGWDVEAVKEIRDHYPEIKLMVDANAAYTLKDVEVFKKLDKYDLMMIEQPLHYKDIFNHSKLQKEIATPICLDESIKSVNDAKAAIEIDATRIINVKPARVGGITETLKIHELSKENDIPLWVGGMLETGIGRAKNVAVASLPHFTLPNDISESERYFQEFIISPPFVLNKNGTLDVPKENGLGIKILNDIIEKKTLGQIVI
ncbi:MAG: o-succinylbenzoate synthase [Candidatus Heimdallarchaeaceae archaeon]